MSWWVYLITQTENRHYAATASEFIYLFFLVRFFFLPFLLVSGSTVPSVDLLLINHQLWFHHCYYLRQHNSSFIVFTQLVRYCRTSGEGTDVLQLMWWEAYQIKSVWHWEERTIMHTHTHTRACVCYCLQEVVYRKNSLHFCLSVVWQQINFIHLLPRYPFFGCGMRENMGVGGIEQFSHTTYG